MKPRSGARSAVDTFRSQAELILSAAVEGSVSAFLRDKPASHAEDKSCLQTVLEAALREALRKLCSVAQLLLEENRRKTVPKSTGENARSENKERRSSAARKNGKKNGTEDAAPSSDAAALGQSPVTISLLNAAQGPITGPVYIISQPLAEQSQVQFLPIAEQDSDEVCPVVAEQEDAVTSLLTSLPAAGELKQVTVRV